MRHARHQAHGNHDACRYRQRLGRGEHLPVDLLPHVLGTGNAGHHDGGGRRQQERRDLRNEAVTDGQQGINLPRLAEAHAVLRHADADAADEVDEQNQQAGDGVAANELARTVHRTVKVRLGGDLDPAHLRLGLIDQPGVEVSVDRHLLARHGVEGEARADFGDPPGTFGNHDEVDDHQNREDDDTDDVVAADHHVAERLDHVASR